MVEWGVIPSYGCGTWRKRSASTALAERPWGQEEFTVEDHEWNWLTFWTKNSTD